MNTKYPMHINEMYKKVMAGEKVFENVRVYGNPNPHVEKKFREYLDEKNDIAFLSQPLKFANAVFEVNADNGIYLPFTYFYNVEIDKSYVPKSDFSHAYLENVRIKDSNLSKAWFDHAIFDYVSIINTTIRDASFEGFPLTHNMEKLAKKEYRISARGIRSIIDGRVLNGRSRREEDIQEYKKSIELQQTYLYNEFLP